MNTRIAAIMTKNVIVAKPENSLFQLMEFFHLYKIQHIPVCENENELVGIISVNDMLNFIYKLMKEGKAVNENVLNLSFTANDLMTKNPVSISSYHTIEDALNLLAEGKFQSVPVVDEGRIVGIVTNKDLVKRLNA